jgi:hypothetical protein
MSWSSSLITFSRACYLFSLGSNYSPQNPVLSVLLRSEGLWFELSVVILYFSLIMFTWSRTRIHFLSRHAKSHVDICKLCRIRRFKFRIETLCCLIDKVAVIPVFCTQQHNMMFCGCPMSSKSWRSHYQRLLALHWYNMFLSPCDLSAFMPIQYANCLIVQACDSCQWS